MEKSPEAYKTISEAADELGVEQHVLRFWETKFTQIKPLKRRGGRRFYRPEDMDTLRRIHELLKNQGFTIKGAKKILVEKTAPQPAVIGAVPEIVKPATQQLDLLGHAPVPAAGINAAQRKKLTSALAKLESARNHLQSVA